MAAIKSTSIFSRIQIECMKLMTHMRTCSRTRVFCVCILGVIVMAWTCLIRFWTTSNYAHSNGGQSKKIGCQTYQFSPRRDQEGFMESWEHARGYVRENHLTFLPDAALAFHREKIMEIETEGVTGMILECGVAKAGSSITFAAIKSHDRCLHLFDTFEGIPEPSQKDGQDVHKRYQAIQKDKKNCLEGQKECNEGYYGNLRDLLAFVKDQFHRALPEASNVFFHKGLFEDTVWPDGPVAYAHLDGDWYESTMGMLKRISPFLSVGGYFVLDDVFTWSGARTAFVEYFDVDLEWLQKQDPKECCSERYGKRYLVFIGERAGAKRLSSSEEGSSLPPCAKKT